MPERVCVADHKDDDAPTSAEDREALDAAEREEADAALALARDWEEDEERALAILVGKAVCTALQVLWRVRPEDVPRPAPVTTK